MILRPVDENGDILPVLSSGELLRDAAAEARLVQDRLELLVGDWWENPAWGNETLELLKEGRLAEADGQSLAGYLTSYIRETDGVVDVRDVSFEAKGRRFSYSCTVECADGNFQISYEI